MTKEVVESIIDVVTHRVEDLIGQKIEKINQEIAGLQLQLKLLTELRTSSRNATLAEVIRYAKPEIEQEIKKIENKPSATPEYVSPDILKDLERMYQDLVSPSYIQSDKTFPWGNYPVICKALNLASLDKP